MQSLATLTVVLFLTIVAPLIVIFYFVTRWKETREISGDDERMLEDLWILSQKLEDRIETLERILDDEPPQRRRDR